MRRADLDVLGHVNNAVHWALVEELFAGEPERLAAPCTVEVEYRGGLDPAMAVSVVATRDRTRAWILGDGTPVATVVLA